MRKTLASPARALWTAAAVVALVTATAVAIPAAAHAAAGRVLILGTTVTGGTSSIEAQEVSALGLIPVVVDDATWSTLTQAEFGSYRALILGDPTCGSAVPTAAVQNGSTWGPAVTGNVVVNGTDPVYHAGQGGGVATRRFVDFALADPAKTGAYVSLSCYYHGTGARTAVPLLNALRPGGFSVTGVGCFNDAHVVAQHPALAGLTDGTLSNWSCSVHEGFDTSPPDFTVLAIARNYGSTFTASDGSVGTPYILARGSGLRSFPLSISPVTDTAGIGGVHAVTAQLLDPKTAAPAPGIAIKFLVTQGPDAGARPGCAAASCVTDASGLVTALYANNGQVGQDTIVAFLDTNANDRPDIGEFQAFAGMDWTVVANTYLALGDSYQSGEGAYNYEPSTNVSGDKCHRSTVSYPYIITGLQGVPSNRVDVACSGALIHNLTDGQNGEPAQFNSLSADDALVTIGIGGNNLGFAPIITACVKGPQLSGDYLTVNQTCHGRFDPQVVAGISQLQTPDASGLSPLQAVYNTIRQGAPHARIIVIGYPHFFKASGNFFGCNLVWRSDEKWIDQKIDDFDAAIQREALSMGAEYVGGANEFDGHELCGDHEAWLNGIVGLGDSESFHPNGLGHARIAQLILDEVSQFQPTTSTTLLQDATFNFQTAVAAGQAFASFSTAWPGSDVRMTLTDPNGRVYTRTTTGADVFHTHGPTTELFRIAHPVPGTWRVALYGASIRPGGEKVSLTVNQALVENQLPVATATAHVLNAAGTTVAYDASGSSDPDGSIGAYEWDFGDGTTAAGSTATHTYTNLGHLYQPTLIVTDNRGGQSFFDLPNVKVHYAFSGFNPPVNPNGVTTRRAGSAIPFKWTLNDSAGAPVTAATAITSYGFDAPGATFQLGSEDGGQYVLVAKTPNAWAGTRHVFTLVLNDKSVHAATVQF